MEHYPRYQNGMWELHHHDVTPMFSLKYPLYLFFLHIAFSIIKHIIPVIYQSK